MQLHLFKTRCGPGRSKFNKYIYYMGEIVTYSSVIYCMPSEIKIVYNVYFKPVVFYN